MRLAVKQAADLRSREAAADRAETRLACMSHES